ncbi:MAG: RidA family protein [Myxococcales bacterium]|nr:RidA family protein [Myxococcales bacterium]
MSKIYQAVTLVFALTVMGMSHRAIAADYKPVKTIVRNPIPGSSFPISQSVQIPAGADTIYMSGTVPQVIDPKAKEGTRAAYGDTEAQTTSVLEALSKRLAPMGLSLSDVVMMRAYLVGDPEKGGKLDFDGFMRGYTKFFGTKEQPNLPARSAFQIAGLARDAWLVEIEVVVVKVPGQ